MSDMVEIHTPAYARPSTDGTRRRVPFPALAPGDRLRIAFVDNEKPNTTEMLRLVERRLGAIYRVEAQRFTKGGAGLPAPRAVIDEAARGADLAIHATSD